MQQPTQTWQCVYTLPEPSGYITSVAISPDRQTFAMACHQLSHRLWDLHTGKLFHILSGHKALVQCLAISPDGKMLVSAAGCPAQEPWHANIRI